MNTEIKGNEELLKKAKRYSNIKYSLSFIDIAYLLLLLFLFLGFGFSRALAENIIKLAPNHLLVLPLYILIACLIYYLFTFPLNLYRTFILEHKFCLSNQKIDNWLGEQLKSGVIFYVILLILFEAFYYILQQAPQAWWLIVWIFWIFFSLILTKLTPIVIIPLFFKYKKLSDETLRQRILNLADKVNPVTPRKGRRLSGCNGVKVRILDVFEIDFSKKTLKANAAFVGWGRSRRVILADTLKDKYTYDEIEVILAHEFAHYKLRHLFKLILVNASVMLLLFYLIFKTSRYALSIFGLASLSEIAAFCLILIYFVVFGIIMQPFELFISRGLERNADKMALSVTGLKEAFISMMNKLAAQNLADRNPHPLIKVFFFDHPPINERIVLAKGG